MLKFLPRNKTEVMGMEFNDSIAQFVQLIWRPKGTKLHSYNRVELPKDMIVRGEIKDEAALKELLANFLENANPNYKKIKNVALLLPTRITFAHIFKFPASFTFKEIKKAIPYQAETLIPFPIEDVYWDIEILNHKQGSQEQSVLFVAVPKKTADSYASLAESMGLRPFIFAFYSDVLNAACQNVYTQGHQILIDYDSISMNYLVLENGKTQHIFSSNKGMSEVKADKLESQVKESLKQAYAIFKEHHENNPPQLNSIIIAGEYSVKAFQIAETVAKEIFPETAVLIGDPKHGIQVEDAHFKFRESDFENQKLYSVFFTHAIGAARMGFDFDQTKSINVLPEALKKSFFNTRWSWASSILLSLLVLVQLVLAGYGLFIHQRLLFEQTELNAEKQNIDRALFGTRYQQVKEELVSFNAEVAALMGIDRSLFSTHSTLEQILEITPSSININEIQFNDEALYLTMDGLAASREDLLSYQEELKTLPFVSEINLPISNFDSKTNLSFSLSISLTFSELPYYAITESN